VRIARVINSEVRSEHHEIPFGWDLIVEDGDSVREGHPLAEEVDGHGVIHAGLSGDVYIEGHQLYIRAELEDVRDYEIPQNARLLEDVFDGMQVTAGQQLTEGSKNPHRILRILGAEAAQHYLLNEVQKVYRNQGVPIADKHFEVVIRKMMSKVQITRSGDSDLLPGELVDKLVFLDMNERLVAKGQEPAAAVPVLLGVTKAALTTDSFLSASSFQHTIKVLAGAAIEGKVDRLYGLKENVIIGKLIPAGTGFFTYQDREAAVNNEQLEAQVVLPAEDDEDEDDEDLVDEIDLDEIEEDEAVLALNDFDEEDEEDLDDEDEVLDDEEDDEDMASLEAVAEDEDEIEDFEEE
jgi:DNA-directed RNA polymerase subunit beta'